MISRKVIIIEHRNPRNKEEKELYGLAQTEGVVSHIFINAQKNRAGQELVDTLFHELCHAALGLYNTSVPKVAEERLSRLVGNLVRDAFRGV